MPKRSRSVEFSKETKYSVRVRQENRCKATRKELIAEGGEYHHLLPVYEALTRYPWLPHALIKSPENCVLVTHAAHRRIHEEIDSWSEEKRARYFQVMMEELMAKYPHFALA